MGSVVWDWDLWPWMVAEGARLPEWSEVRIARLNESIAAVASRVGYPLRHVLAAFVTRWETGH